ncbi:GGDEF domain-containing protein [Cognatiluteimonas profundi]|uniref:GGDEF domain-containing protein n=1 Tax=Cognatiluteimonas profundi TaxID=2594501 RepID=UPI00131B35E8|nr:GGDEF domain-containing protein [Lysobacter profundi]
MPEHPAPAVSEADPGTATRRKPPGRLSAFALGADPRRRIRLTQWLIGTLAYAASGLVLWFGLRLGWMDASRLVPWCIFLATVLAVIYVALRSGWSERFSDPALTVEQLMLGVIGVEWGYLICGPVRSVTLFPLLLIFTFAAFSLSWRKIALLTALTLASLLGTIMVGHALEPGVDTWSLRDANLRLDLINFLMISIMLPALSWLAARLSLLRMRLQSQRTELMQALEQVQRLATHDALTGLCNRRHMEHRLGEEQSRAERQGTPFSVALIDLDHFKRVNDAHGHAGGDRVLQAFAIVAQRNVRGCDLVARWGGEEFLVLMPGSDAPQALDAMERLLDHVRGMPHDAGDPPLSFSAGVAQYRLGEDTAQTILRADQGMYAAKNAGRGRVLAG